MQGKDKAMTYKHDSKAYAIVLMAKEVQDYATNLYHATCRGEDAKWEVEQLSYYHQKLSAALDAWIVGGPDE
jgi:hypothetical protein